MGVSFTYGSVEALKDVSLTVNGGEILSVIGPNGSGKTTLLRCINRILKPKVGSILIDDIDLGKLSREQLAKIIGLVPQMGDIRFPITVFEAVLLGRKPYMGWKPTQKDLEIVSEVLSLLGLEDFSLRSLDELSGGELRMVIIARALAQEPKVLLLDEPTNNLDLKHQVEVLKVIRNYVRKRDLCAIMAMHDLNLAVNFSDRIVMLNKGKIYAMGDSSIINQENIKQVYGVEVEIFRGKTGKPIISLTT